jgi:CubicO group peptidase (beta-lactamase class C family)
MAMLERGVGGLLAALAMLGGAAGPVQAQAQAGAHAPAPAPAFDLERDVQRALDTFAVPGMAVAIVKDGKVVAARGFGVRTLGQPGAVDGQTVFEIASNSKAFTAALLAMLVDEGKLAWDDPVTKHLPDFQMYDPYVTHEMTVRDLLVHRSGLGLGEGDLLWWPTTQFSTDDIIHRLRFMKPAKSFRSAYAYDNLLYIVAGKIAAQKMGMSWGQAVRERILQPLGMTCTTTSLAENAGRTDVAGAHAKVDERITHVAQVPVTNAVGAVGVNTCADDMAKWLNVLLDEGRIPGSDKRLFSAKQSREIWTEQTPIRITEPDPALVETKPNFFSYGFGFQLRDYHGRKLAMHGGALEGFYSRVVLVPEEKLGIAILTNAENSSSMSALSYRILDQYLGVPATDWIGRFAGVEKADHAKELAKLKKLAAARAAKSGPSLPLASYYGQYEDAWYGPVTIGPEGGKTVLRFARTPDLVGELEHYQYDTFIVRWRARHLHADAYVSFSLKPDGSIEHMKMEPVSDETDFSYDFQDLLFTPVKKAE